MQPLEVLAVSSATVLSIIVIIIYLELLISHIRHRPPQQRDLERNRPIWLLALYPVSSFSVVCTIALRARVVPDKGKTGTRRILSFIQSGQVWGIRRNGVSPRPSCDGIPSASVWPSPRQTPGTPCPYSSDRPPSGHRPGRRQARHAHILQIRLHLTQT